MNVASTRHILIVEDDLRLAKLTADYLESNGFKISLCHDGVEAVNLIHSLTPDLVILDIMLPGMDGTQVCRTVRPAFSGGIMMLTARDNDMDELLGLELGADDYVAKPVQPRLLLARIHALLRRVGPIARRASVAKLGGLEVDHARRDARLDGADLALTDAEFDLLALLVEHAGVVVSRDMIMQSLRGLDYDGLDRSVDNRVSRLRRKLQDSAVVLKAVRGRGYLLSIGAGYVA